MKNRDGHRHADRALWSTDRVAHLGILAAAPLLTAFMLWAVAPQVQAAAPATAAPAPTYAVAYRDERTQITLYCKRASSQSLEAGRALCAGRRTGWCGVDALQGLPREHFDRRE